MCLCPHVLQYGSKCWLMLNNLDVQIEEDQKFIDDRIVRIEDKEGITLDDYPERGCCESSKKRACYCYWRSGEPVRLQLLIQ